MENFKGPGQLAHLERVLSEHWGGQSRSHWQTCSPDGETNAPISNSSYWPDGLLAPPIGQTHQEANGQSSMIQSRISLLHSEKGTKSS